MGITSARNQVWKMVGAFLAARVAALAADIVAMDYWEKEGRRYKEGKGRGEG
jgi:hypothetical protein